MITRAVEMAKNGPRHPNVSATRDTAGTPNKRPSIIVLETMASALDRDSGGKRSMIAAMVVVGNAEAIRAVTTRSTRRDE